MCAAADSAVHHDLPHLSNLTIALCYPITWTAASVMFLLYYKFGKWLPAYPQKQPDIG